MSDETPEGMFNFEPVSISSDLESPSIIFPSFPSIYGPDFTETRINLTVNYPKPPKSSPNISKIMRKFESESKIRLYEAMTISHSSANPTASDSAWEAYKVWVNSKISKLKYFGYQLTERKFLYGFIPLMEIWKLRNSQLCPPALEVKEATPEVVEEEVALETVTVQQAATAQEDDVVSEHQDCVMEEVVAQIVVSETHQIRASGSQPPAGFGEIPIGLLKTIKEIKVDNVMVKERLDKHDIIF